MRKLTEQLDKQRKMVQIGRSKAKVTEKMISESKERILLQRPFTLYEFFLVHEKADVKAVRTS